MAARIRRGGALPHQHVYNKGFQAALEGLPRESCPYATSSKGGWDLTWLRGWRDGQRCKELGVVRQVAAEAQPFSPAWLERRAMIAAFRPE